MILRRRELLKLGGSAIAAAWAGNAFAFDLTPNQFAGSLSSLPILQTATNSDSAQFRILNSLGRRLHYEVTDSQGRKLSVEHLNQFAHPAWPTHSVDHLKVTSLVVGESYLLKVSDDSVVLDERVFTSLDSNLVSPRIAVISCVCDDFPVEQAEMWRVVGSELPDMVFLVGDASYLDGRDSDDERGIWRRHLEVRNRTGLFFWKNLKPVYAVWDDHDFGINDGGADFALKNATLQMFEAMFGSAEILGYSKGPSLAQEISVGEQRYYLMDGRFYRTKNVSQVAQATHWGSEQEEWFFSRLNTSAAPSFIMNGSQFFGGYSGYESFEKEHPEQFSRIHSRLKQSAAPVVLASGDRHFSEVMQIEENILGYKTLELTSSSLHSYSPKAMPPAANRRRVAAAHKHNFLSVTSSVNNNALSLDVKCIGAGNRRYFENQTVVRR